MSLFTAFLLKSILFDMTIATPAFFCRIHHYDMSISVALHGMAYSFNELLKPLCYDKAMIYVLENSWESLGLQRDQTSQS